MARRIPSSEIQPSTTRMRAPTGFVGDKNGAVNRIAPKIRAANVRRIASQPFQVGTQISLRLKSMRRRLLRQGLADGRKKDFFDVEQRPAKRLFAANRNGLVALLE